MPARVAVTNATKGLATAKIGSSRAYVTEMESSPDSEVEIKKAVVAPFLPSCLHSDAAAGNPPHDHNGIRK